MSEIVVWGAIVLGSGSAVAVIAFWMNLASKLATAEAKAASAENEASDANDRITAMSAAFALFREQVAREYVSRDVLREFEDRITRSIDKLSEKFDRVLDK